MNKSLNNLIATFNMILALGLYTYSYYIIVNSHTKSKEWTEFLTLVSGLIFIICGISLVSIIKNNTSNFRPILYNLGLFTCIGIIPLIIIDVANIIPISLISIGLALVALYRNKIKARTFLIANIILGILNIVWGIFIIRM